MLTRNRKFISGRRRGSLYILTLASAIILVALVMGTAVVIGQFRRYSRSNYHGELAKNYAESGIRHAIYFTTVAPDWRQLLNSGVWLQDIPVDQATYTVKGIDTVDADLANNINDPVLFISTATVGNISRTVQVEAIEEKTPHELLNYAVAAGSNIDMKVHAVINGDVFSNGNISKTEGSTIINGDAEAVGTIGGTDNITGTISPGSDPKEFPDAAAILQYYKSIAIDIPFQPTIENVLLSPTSNPYGVPNPDGLYKIVCGNQKIEIKNCRIVGTLLLIQPQSDSKIYGGINWRSARADYPALIVDGPFTVEPDINMDEDKQKVDFSLPGEPGAGSMTDIYPNEIRGLIYSNGDLVVNNTFNLQGTIITTGNCLFDGDAMVVWDPAVLDNPPVGFYESRLAPIRGTWRLVAP